MKRKFRVLTPEEINSAYKYQKKNKDWTFFQEREFLETLCQHRFNYLILIYTLFVGVFFQADSKNNKLIILWLGAFLILFLGLLLYRVYVKLIIALRILYELGVRQPSSVIQKETKAKRLIGLFGANWIMGIFIPLSMFLSFIAGIIAIHKGKL